MLGSQGHSVIQHPLNTLLGTEANVRILRALAHVADEPLGATDAARYAGMSTVGTRKALKRLVRSGFVTSTGGVRSRQYKLTEKEPLLAALKALFKAEQARFDDFLRHLREGLGDIPELRAAWVNKLPTTLGDPIEVIVVTEAKAISWIGEELRARVFPLEARFNQVIELLTFTRADAPEQSRGALHLLVGPVPDNDRFQSTRSSHSTREERALRMSGGITELIQADPTLIKRAIRHLDRLIQEGQGPATGDLLEWRGILETYSAQRVREFLVSTTSRARRLRQSSPFFAVLTADERDKLIERHEEQ